MKEFKLPKMDEKVIIGLTGAIGSGKSAALKEFEKLGAFTLSADEIVAGLLKEDTGCVQELKKKFGAKIFDAQGKLDKQAFASVIFGSGEDRLLAETIIHPCVFEKAAAIITKTQNPVIVFEVPLLFEANMQDAFDLTVCVYAGYEEREERTLKRGLSKDDFLRREAAQMPLKEKAALADCVIENAQGFEQLREQVTEIYEFAKKIRSK